MLEIGDVVELKSGGARMTVITPDIEGKYVEVIWMDSSGLKHEARIPRVALSRVNAAMEDMQRLIKNHGDLS